MVLHFFFILFLNSPQGKLDCLREIISLNPDSESAEEKVKRLAAEWDGDCSFEAEGTGNLKVFFEIIDDI
jgi:hypothetical protein